MALLIAIATVKMQTIISAVTDDTTRQVLDAIFGIDLSTWTHSSLIDG